MSAWIAYAFQGPVAAIEAARIALQAGIVAGTISAHQIALIRPPFGEPPGPPAILRHGEATFGFVLVAGLDYPTPQGCEVVHPMIAGVVLGISGMEVPSDG